MSNISNKLKLFTKRIKAKKAMTIIEMCVVICIIAIILSMLIPTIMSYINQTKSTKKQLFTKSLYEATASAVVESTLLGVDNGSGFEELEVGKSSVESLFTAVESDPNGNIDEFPEWTYAYIKYGEIESWQKSPEYLTSFRAYFYDRNPVVVRTLFADEPNRAYYYPLDVTFKANENNDKITSESLTPDSSLNKMDSDAGIYINDGSYCDHNKTCGHRIISWPEMVEQEMVVFDEHNKFMLKEIKPFVLDNSNNIVIKDEVNVLYNEDENEYYCENYESWEIPSLTLVVANSISQIDNYALKCNIFTEIKLNAALKKIGAGCFFNSRILEKISFHSNCALREFPDPLYFDDKNEYGQGLFGYCTNLRDVKFPQDLIYIGMYCFEDCHSLENVNLPSSVKYMREGAFSSSGLKIFDAPRSLKYLEYQAFLDCFQLETVNLNNIEYIDNEVFTYSNLKELTFKRDLTLSSRALTTIPNLEKIYGANGATLGLGGKSTIANCPKLKTLDVARICIGNANSNMDEYEPFYMSYCYGGTTPAVNTIISNGCPINNCPLLSEINVRDKSCYDSLFKPLYTNATTINSVSYDTRKYTITELMANRFNIANNNFNYSRLAYQFLDFENYLQSDFECYKTTTVENFNVEVMGSTQYVVCVNEKDGSTGAWDVSYGDYGDYSIVRPWQFFSYKPKCIADVIVSNSMAYVFENNMSNLTFVPKTRNDTSDPNYYVIIGKGYRCTHVSKIGDFMSNPNFSSNSKQYTTIPSNETQAMNDLQNQLQNKSATITNNKTAK